MAKRSKSNPEMPKHIILGAKKIKLRVGTSDLENDRFAHFDYNRQEIVLHPKIGDNDRSDSVMHEFVHASMAFRGVDLPPKTEERVATALGADLQELIMRNRPLIEWIWKGCP